MTAAAAASSAPHEGDVEVIFPPHLRPKSNEIDVSAEFPDKVNYRFRVPDGRCISFVDNNFGPQSFVTGSDFGDFVVWCGSTDMVSYELAVVVDDSSLGVTEVVRGCDLLLSTARQILLYEALSLPIPSFFHCSLVRDENGDRMAKRNASTTLRGLRDKGWSPQDIREKLFQTPPQPAEND